MKKFAVLIKQNIFFLYLACLQDHAEEEIKASVNLMLLSWHNFWFVDSSNGWEIKWEFNFICKDNQALFPLRMNSLFSQANIQKKDAK